MIFITRKKVLIWLFHFRHLRKGKVGSYRDDMSDELIKRFDQWIAEKLKETDFKFFE